MALETCQILGLVSHILLCGKKNLPDGKMWSGREINEKTAYIQARSFMARTLEVNGTECHAEGEAKVSHEKLHLENARKLSGIYFIDPRMGNSKETMKNARKKLEASIAPAMLWKICEEKLWEWCIQKNLNKTCVHSGSQRIYKIAYGRIIADLSWRPYCRKKKQFITALQFGAQIYSFASSHKKNSSSKCKQWTKNWKNWRKSRRGTWQKSEIRKEVIDEARTSGRHSSFCLTDGHLSFEKCWIGGKAPENTKVELYPRRFCKKMILYLMQYSLNKDHQHHKWQQQESWISYPDCQGARDKQLTQYLLEPK